MPQPQFGPSVAEMALGLRNRERALLNMQRRGELTRARERELRNLRRTISEDFGNRRRFNEAVSLGEERAPGARAMGVRRFNAADRRASTLLRQGRAEVAAKKAAKKAAAKKKAAKKRAAKRKAAKKQAAKKQAPAKKRAPAKKAPAKRAPRKRASR